MVRLFCFLNCINCIDVKVIREDESEIKAELPISVPFLFVVATMYGLAIHVHVSRFF